MSLSDQLLIDASAVFCNTSDFAELVTYRPHRFYGDAERPVRTISGVVIREQLSVFSEDGDTILAVYQVHVANDSDVGIASSEIDLGGDQIEFPPREGMASERRSIVKMSEHDPGMLVLECR